MSHFKKIEKIQATEGQIMEIENFLSQDEVRELLNYINSTKNIFVDRDDSKRFSFNNINKKPVRNINQWGVLFKKTILNKLNKIFKDVDFYVDEEDFPPHIFKVFYPTKLHADTGQNNSEKVIYKQILIPLEIDPKESEVHTVYFKNRYYEASANFREKTSKIQPIYIKDKNGKFIKIEDLNDLYELLKKSENLKNIIYKGGSFLNSLETKNKVKKLINEKRYNKPKEAFDKNKPFSKEIYQKYLTHSDIGDYSGLEFWKAIKWKVGNMIIWDRSILHASSNFLKDKTVSKTGVGIFFNRNI